MALQAALGVASFGMELAGGIMGGKKAKKAAKKQKRIAQAVSAEAAVQSQAAKEIFQKQQEQFELEKAIVSQQRRQDKIQSIREARVKRSMILQSAVNSGAALNSSAVSGGVGSLSTQFASSLGLNNVFTNLSDNISNLQTDINDQQGVIMDSQGKVAQLTGQTSVIQGSLDSSLATANMLRGFGQAGGSIFQQMGGFTSIAGGNKPTGSVNTIFSRPIRAGATTNVNIPGM